MCLLQRLEDKASELVPPNGERKVLLHSCCAPCSGSVIEDIHQAGIDLAIFFYNPNIHPQKEYQIRKEENIRYAEKMGIPFVDADYDTDRWFHVTSGHETDPERGERCGLCFDMRFVEAAEYAAGHGFKVFTSCLGISRWKDFDQVTRAGIKAASLFPGISYWAYNWRKKGGSERMIRIAKEEGFYQQQYCGCVYSLRDTNKWRKEHGRPPVEIGKDFYSVSPKSPAGLASEVS
ncbi:MAG: epoxyqueuosine reductase QueH [Candidatus Omnitrophica bacterium]|nr:epoxyqueuosine reductase QueH [Candidatus Omnitrophota bacterium]